MKWNKLAIISVVVILSISYIYSRYNQNQLSQELKQTELIECKTRADFDCNLINIYHNECFQASNRSEFKIRSFHANEYRQCLHKKVGKSVN